MSTDKRMTDKELRDLVRKMAGALEGRGHTATCDTRHNRPDAVICTCGLDNLLAEALKETER